MERWRHSTILILAGIAVLAVSYAYSRQVGSELLLTLEEIAELERIPVLAREPE